MAQEGSSRTIFTVRIDGLDLDEESVQRLAGAIRRTVLGEFAELDIPKAIRVGRIGQPGMADAGNGGNGGTQGIDIVAAEM